MSRPLQVLIGTTCVLVCGYIGWLIYSQASDAAEARAEVERLRDARHERNCAEMLELKGNQSMDAFHATYGSLVADFTQNCIDEHGG